MTVKSPTNSVTLACFSGILGAALISGCSGSSPDSVGFGGSTTTSPPGSGGAGLGGATGQGGALQPNAGGTNQTNPAGGTSAQTGGSGGTSTTPASGGSGQGGLSTGGTNAAVGGSIPAGGKATGGSISIGGTTSTGGTTSKGGTTSTTTGGSSPVGGAAPAGGASPTGGTTGAGGSSQPPSCTPPTTGHYQMEDLDRGVVAVKVSGGVYIGWRMMGYEYDPTTPANVAYNLYKGGTKLATVTNSTNYLDAAGTTSSSYSVSAVIGGTECAKSEAVTPWAQQYLTIPLTPPGSGYSANDASTGDLDGDGKLDIVLKWDPSDSKDSSVAGTTGVVYLDGYTLAGTRLWRIDVGMNIRAGAHDTQFSVYDFDGDGKAEVAFKTAPGTKDGTGAYLKTGPAATASHTTDYRSSRGMALGGPEWLTVFSGTTGAELATVEYPVLYGSSSWGDTNGNRSHRYQGGVSFVSDTGSGKTATGRPSIIQQRGYYTRLTVSAYNWRSNALTKVWTFDSNVAANSAASGQGNHSTMTADVDNDGAMEIIPGSSTINSDGTFRCSARNGHGDALHVGALIKGKGIHVFMPHETDGGHDCHDASTCVATFDTVGSGDNGRGVAEWVSMSSLTSASCTSSAGGSVNCADGSAGAPSAGSNFLIYWNADEARETMNGVSLPGGVSTAGTSSCNGTKATPTLTADLLGDWREELVARTTDNTALRVYTTVDVTARRIYTLMHDPTYRMQVSFEQTSYNQPPHVGFHIGAGMAAPPKPDIHVK